MKSSRKNEQLVFPYLESRGRVGLNELEIHFVSSQEKSTGKMSKEALYRTLERLEEKGKIKRIEIPRGEKKRVYYEIPLVDAQAQVKRFIEQYKIKNNQNPIIEEIAVGIGKTPEETQKAVYSIAKEVEWRDPSKPTVIEHASFFGRFTEKLNRDEVQLILEKLRDEHTFDVAVNHLYSMSFKQDLLQYPSLLSFINRSFELVKNQETVELLLGVVYNLVISPTFKERRDELNFSKHHRHLLNILLKIVSDEAYSSKARQDALILLGTQRDERVIDILISSLENAEGEPGSECHFKFKEVFNNWAFYRFYQEYKLQLLERSFILAEKNMTGAKILIDLINKNWGVM